MHFKFRFIHFAPYVVHLVKSLQRLIFRNGGSSINVQSPAALASEQSLGHLVSPATTPLVKSPACKCTVVLLYSEGFPFMAYSARATILVYVLIVYIVLLTGGLTALRCLAHSLHHRPICRGLFLDVVSAAGLPA